MKDFRNKASKQKYSEQKYLKQKSAPICIHRYTQRCAQVLIAFFLSQSLSYVSLPAFADNNSIKIAGQPLFDIPNIGDSTTVAKRTETIQDNLDNALVAAKDRTPASVNIIYVKGTPVITMGGYQVATVTAADATAFKTTPALLANQWADKIRSALTDQSSVNTYVSQLSNDYAASAPVAKANDSSSTSPGQYNANQAKVNPQQTAMPNNLASPAQSSFAPNTNHTYDSYNSNSYNNSGSASLNTSPGNGAYAPGPPGSSAQGNAGSPGAKQGRIAYAQAGQVIPVTLSTSIATQVARVGDLIEATVSQNVTVGDSIIPAGTQVIGQVTEAKAGGHFTHSGDLQIKFNRLRLPDGSESPITAHIVGTIGKYAEVGGDQSDEYKGETLKNKVGSVAFRGLLGAGGGAALGTAVGAIAGGGYGAGMGAWSGAAIGGGLGAADSLILRKGKDVTIPSGTNLKLQLDSPVAISGVNPAGGYQ